MLVENIAKQIIDFQKSTFDNSFNAMVMLQDQTERLTRTMMDQAGWLPEESKKMMDGWAQMVKKGRDDWKELVDDNFDKLADFFEEPSAIMPQAKAQKPKPAKPAQQTQ
jgi:hypothetical protein